MTLASKAAAAKPLARKSGVRRRKPLRVDVIVDAGGWKRRMPDVTERVHRWARAAVAAAVKSKSVPLPPMSRPWTVTILLGDDMALRALNGEFRAKDKPTNVLSFPAWEAGSAARRRRGRRAETVHLGDIAIAYGVTDKESRNQFKKLSDHLAHLTVHGVLHLFGYDHIHPSQADDMESLERAVLARLGIADPYVIRVRRKAAVPARHR